MGKYCHRQLLCRFSHNSHEVQGAHLFASVPRALCCLHTGCPSSCLFWGEVKVHEQLREMRTEDITSENPGMIFSKDNSECGKDNFPQLPNSSECNTADEDFQRLTTAQTRLQTATTKKKKNNTPEPVESYEEYWPNFNGGFKGKWVQFCLETDTNP